MADATNVAGLLKPKPFSLNDMDGNPVNVVLSRFPMTAGRRILCTYPISALPKIGNYDENEKAMELLMSFVAVIDKNDHAHRMITQALRDNHIPDAETCLRIEHAQLEYNSTFFQKGRLSNFFDECIQMFLAKIFATSTPSQQQSSEKNLQPSNNSAQSTT